MRPWHACHGVQCNIRISACNPRVPSKVSHARHLRHRRQQVRRPQQLTGHVPTRAWEPGRTCRADMRRGEHDSFTSMASTALRHPDQTPVQVYQMRRPAWTARQTLTLPNPKPRTLSHERMDAAKPQASYALSERMDADCAHWQWCRHEVNE